MSLKEGFSGTEDQVSQEGVLFTWWSGHESISADTQTLKKRGCNPAGAWKVQIAWPRRSESPKGLIVLLPECQGQLSKAWSCSLLLLTGTGSRKSPFSLPLSNRTQGPFCRTKPEASCQGNLEIIIYTPKGYGTVSQGVLRAERQ